MWGKYCLVYEPDPIRRLFAQVMIGVLIGVVVHQFFTKWEKYMATKAKGNDNIPTPEVEEVYVLPKFNLEKPTLDELFVQFFYFHFVGVRRFCSDNSNNGMDNMDYDQISKEAFQRMIISYEKYVKVQLKTYEDKFNRYDEQLDNRFRKEFQSRNDSTFFPILCFLKDQHRWNSNHRVDLVSNFQLPNPEIMYQVFYNTCMEMEQKYDARRLGLQQRQQLYRQAFDATISVYEMQIIEQMQVQTTIWFHYGQRMSRKLKVLQGIQCSTFYQKVKWSCQLQFQEYESERMEKK